MTTPREPVGGAFEASRLLQEGLELLAERTREVDAVVQQARERARQHIEEAQERADDITAAAEQRAQEITAEAERSRADVEAQLAALRAELDEARRELGQLRTAHSDGASKARAAIASVAAAASAVATGSSSTPTAAASPQPAPASAPPPASAPVKAAASTSAPPPIVIDTASTPEGSDAGAAPHWGRRASMPQATPNRPARRRWLPPWLPFVLLLLAGIAIVTALFSGQAGAGSQPADSSSNGVIVVTSTPPSPTPVAGASGLGVAAATTIATSVAMVASSLADPAPSGTPAATSLSGASPGPTLTGQATVRATPRLNPTLTQPRSTVGVASSPRVAVPSPIALPDAAKPDGAVVGAYTAYSTYVVRAGDTLNQVAEEVGVSRESIISASQLTDPNLLQPGQVLTIPHDNGWLYRVQPADTLEQIAQRFGVRIEALIAGNALPSPVVHAGDLLLIPNQADSGPK